MCEKCDGTGWIKVYDSVPYGSTNVRMESSEMCDCLEKNECPQCGAELTESTEKTLYGTAGLLFCTCGYRTNF